MVSLTFILLITASAVTPIKVGSNRLYVLGLALSLCLFASSSSLELYNGYLVWDQYRILLVLLCYLVGLVCISSEVCSLVLLGLLGTSLLLISNHLSTIIVALELQSFTSYGLAYLSSNTPGSSLKYLLLGALASSFIMLSVAWIYVESGVLDINTILLLGVPSIAFVLLLVGFLFKLGVAPFHQWVPDVYDNIRNSTIAYLSLVPKIGVLGFLSVLGSWNNELILTVSILTIVLGSIGGLMQTKYRRLLAYSSISHIGYLLLASTLSSNSVLLVYLIQYLVTTLSVLYCFQALDTNKTGRLSSVIESNPYIASLLGVLLFSLAGVPFFAGFFAKLEVFYSLVSDQYVWLLLVAIVTSIIGAYYYLRVIMLILNNNNNNNTSSINTIIKYIVVSGVALITFSVLEGNTLLQLAQLMAQHTEYYVSL